MADEQLIKPRELPAATTVFADDAIMTDNGSIVGKATPVQIVNAGAPVPTEAEAIAGTDNSKRMTPLTVKQVLDSVTAPSVLRAQAWAESDSPPNPGIPGSMSAKSWAAEAERLGSEQADRAEAAAAQAALYDGPWLNSQDDIEADTTISTIPGSPGYVPVGGYVRTRKEGFSYTRVADGGHRVTSGGVRLDVIAGERGFDVVAFGASKNGVTNNSAIFEKVNKALQDSGGGVAYVPAVNRGLGEFYLIDRPIDLIPNVIWEGDGADSLIFNTRATGTGLFGDHAVFNPGNYHPEFFGMLPWADLDGVSAGDRVVYLDAGSFSVGDFPPGHTVVLRGGSVTTSAGFDIYEWQRLNRIVSSDPNTGAITLTYAIDKTVTSPQISLTDGQVNSTRIGYSDGTPRKCFVAYKSGLRNIGVKSNSLWVADSATLDCKFENVWIESRRGLYGNSYCHTTWRNIRAKVKECALEWSCNSHDSDIDGYSVDSDYSIPTVVAFAIFGENSENCHLRNFTFCADNWANSNVMLRFAFTQDCSISSGVIQAKRHTGGDIQFESNPDNTPCRGNEVFDVKFYKSAPSTTGVNFGGTGLVEDNGVDNCEWVGEDSVRHGYIRGNGNRLTRCIFSDASSALDITSATAENCVIEDNDLTAGFTVVNGSEYRKHKIRNNQTIAGKLARGASVRTFSRDSVTSTTSGNVYRSSAFPAGSLKGGDRVRVVARGRASTATTAPKELRLVDDSATYGAISFAIGESGTFSFDATIIVDGQTTLVGYTTSEKAGAFSVARQAVTGLSLGANSRTFSLQAWTGFAAEDILFDQCEIWVEKIGQ